MTKWNSLYNIGLIMSISVLKDDKSDGHVSTCATITIYHKIKTVS